MNWSVLPVDKSVDNLWISRPSLWITFCAGKSYPQESPSYPQKTPSYPQSYPQAELGDFAALPALLRFRVEFSNISRKICCYLYDYATYSINSNKVV